MMETQIEIWFREEQVSLSDLERRIQFIKDLPLQYCSKIPIESTVRVGKTETSIFPKKTTISYEGLENIKNCTIKSNQKCTEIYSNQRPDELYLFHYSDEKKE